MKKYKVSLIEKVPYVVFVEAKSVREAKLKAEKIFIKSHAEPVDKYILEQWGDSEIQIKGTIDIRFE